MKNIIFLFLIVCSTTLVAQPGTDIYLFDLKVKGKTVTVSNGKNINNRKGYDNQPFFHPKKSALYFVSADTAGRTDIMEYNYDVPATRKITFTHDKEYSPTVTPDQKYLSCILQRDNGAQDLVKYPIDGGEPEVIINNLIVGYHAWLNEKNVAVFTLPQPFKLHLIDIEKKSDTVVTQSISRSIHKIPKRQSISFIQKVDDASWEIREVSASLEQKAIVKSLNNVEHDMAWTQDGKIIMSDQQKLFFCEPNKSSSWTEIILPAELKDKTITRISVSADGKKIALVVSE